MLKEFDMKKITKILSAAILCAIAICSFACVDSGADAKEPGLYCKKFKGDDYYTVYAYVDDGKTTSLNIAEYAKEHNGVENVGAIKEGAFEGNSSLTEIIVPSTVVEIKEGAFKGMKNLKKITLPFVGATARADAYYGETAESENKSVDAERVLGYIFGSEEYEGGAAISQSCGSGDATTYYMPYTLTEVTVAPAADYKLPMYAFNGCSNLIKVTLKDKVTAIGVSAFEDCKKLETVELASTVKNIYAGAFKGCEKLADYDADKKVGLNFNGAAFELIDDEAFYKTAIKNINLSVKKIGDKAFAESSLESLTLTGVKEIGSYAFYKCEKLSAVSITTVAESETSIGVSAFEDCKNADVGGLIFTKRGENWNKGTKNS